VSRGGGKLFARIKSAGGGTVFRRGRFFEGGDPILLQGHHVYMVIIFANHNRMLRRVVAADCMIKVSAYSASGGDADCIEKIGHVKLDGAVVWQGSCGGSVVDTRGVNILLVDPFSCSVLETRRFDTTANESTDLSNYLLSTNRGDVIVGVSDSEPQSNLAEALPVLQQLGVDLGDLQHRGPFAFIVQKGHSDKTVLSKALDEKESKTKPARLNAEITGRPTFFLQCDLKRRRRRSTRNILHGELIQLHGSSSCFWRFEPARV